jgi:hypothetical protein
MINFRVENIHPLFSYFIWISPTTGFVRGNILHWRYEVRIVHRDINTGKTNKWGNFLCNILAKYETSI